MCSVHFVLLPPPPSWKFFLDSFNDSFGSRTFFGHMSETILYVKGLLDCKDFFSVNKMCLMFLMVVHFKSDLHLSSHTCFFLSVSCLASRILYNFCCNLLLIIFRTVSLCTSSCFAIDFVDCFRFPQQPLPNFLIKRQQGDRRFSFCFDHYSHLDCLIIECHCELLILTHSGSFLFHFYNLTYNATKATCTFSMRNFTG